MHAGGHEVSSPLQDARLGDEEVGSLHPPSSGASPKATTLSDPPRLLHSCLHRNPHGVRPLAVLFNVFPPQPVTDFRKNTFSHSASDETLTRAEGGGSGGDRGQHDHEHEREREHAEDGVEHPGAAPPCQQR